MTVGKWKKIYEERNNRYSGIKLRLVRFILWLMDILCFSVGLDPYTYCVDVPKKWMYRSRRKILEKLEEDFHNGKGID